MSDNIYILGSAMIKFGKYLDRNIKSLTGEALDLVVKDCGLNLEALQAAWFSNSAWGIHTFQHCIRGQIALSANGLEEIPITNVENACAGGSTAFHGAWTAVKAGLYDCVLAIGAEKLYSEDRAKTMEGFLAGMDVEVAVQEITRFAQEDRKRREEEARKKGVELPPEKAGGHSVFMDWYAIGARRHMEKYGTTQRQLAAIAAKNHNNSTLNPLAQYTFPQTIEQVLGDREVAWPLTRSMCAPIGDGAAAAVICSEDFLKKHPSGRAVKVLASVLQSGNRNKPTDISARAARIAYEMSGVGPGDIDMAEVHDATAFGELHQVEQMGGAVLAQVPLPQLEQPPREGDPGVLGDRHQRDLLRVSSGPDTGVGHTVLNSPEVFGQPALHEVLGQSEVVRLLVYVEVVIIIFHRGIDIRSIHRCLSRQIRMEL